MKKLLLLQVLGLAILAGCAQQNKVEQKIGITADQIFEKKEQCIKYIDIVQDRFRDEQEEGKKMLLEEDPNDDSHEDFSLDSVFYSPKLNTCVYAGTHTLAYTVDGRRVVFETLVIGDALTKDGIYAKVYNLSGAYESVMSEWTQKIAELKGE